jgi:hypothetical protein
MARQPAGANRRLALLVFRGGQGLFREQLPHAGLPPPNLIGFMP